MFTACGKDNRNGLDVTLMNNTTEEIVGVAVSPAEEGKFTDNLLADGVVFAPKGNQKIVVAEDKAKAKDKYDLKIIFENGREALIRNIDFKDIDDGEIAADSEQVYLTYKSLSSKKEVSISSNSSIAG